MTDLSLDEITRLQAFQGRACTAVTSGNPGGAIPIIEEALTIARPAWLLSNYGDALARCGRLPEAVRAFEEAMVVDPTYPEAPYNLGVIYNQLSEENLARREEYLLLARASYRRSLDCRVKATAENNLANIEMYLCEFEACEKHYRAAIKHRFSDATWNLSLCLMMQGRWREAWDQYEYRPQRAALGEDGNIWRGESLKDRSILVNMEQGLGDQVFAMRYLPIMVEQGAKVAVACDAPMTRLMQQVPGIQVIERGAPGQSVMVDFVAMSMSLPGYLSPDGVGPSGACVQVPTMARSADVFTVGICWNGSTYLGPPGERNLPLKILRALSEIEGVKLVSLQKGGGVEELDDCGFHVERTAIENCRDVFDTAVLMNSLDLVLTIDTLIPHLAGAIGKPCWLLNRWASCWQWGTLKQDPILYDSIQQFRQESRGDWSVPVAQVVYGLSHALAAMKAARAPQPDQEVTAP